MKPPTTKTSKVRTIKAYAVKWFGEIQPVGRKIPTLYSSKREAQSHYRGEKIKVIPCTISYPFRG